MKKFFVWTAIVIFGLLFVVVFVGGLYPSFEYGNSVQVNASPDKCFNVLTDSSQLRNWMKGFTSYTLVRGQHLAPGAQYELVITDGERMEMQQTLLSLTPDKKIDYILVNDVLHSQYNYTIFRDGVTSTISTHYRIEGKNVFMRAILLFSKSYLKKADEELLRELKRVIESNG